MKELHYAHGYGIIANIAGRGPGACPYLGKSGREMMAWAWEIGWRESDWMRDAQRRTA